MKQITTLTHEDAQKALEVIKAEILKRGKAAVITVADAHGELIALLRLDGAAYTCIQIDSFTYKIDEAGFSLVQSFAAATK